MALPSSNLLAKRGHLHEWNRRFYTDGTCTSHINTCKSNSCEIFSQVLWSWISKSGKFLLKLKVHPGKFAPRENNPPSGTIGTNLLLLVFAIHWPLLTQIVSIINTEYFRWNPWALQHSIIGCCLWYQM